jgi:hypothetical protein
LLSSIGLLLVIAGGGLFLTRKRWLRRRTHPKRRAKKHPPPENSTELTEEHPLQSVALGSQSETSGSVVVADLTTMPMLPRKR